MTKKTIELSAAEARVLGDPKTFKDLPREQQRAVVRAAIRESGKAWTRAQNGK